MKTSILLVLLAAAFSCSAQTKETVTFKSDTIIIPIGSKYKVVKIGDNVYKITQPTLEPVGVYPTIRFNQDGYAPLKSYYYDGDPGMNIHLDSGFEKIQWDTTQFTKPRPLNIIQPTNGPVNAQGTLDSIVAGFNKIEQPSTITYPMYWTGECSICFPHQSINKLSTK